MSVSGSLLRATAGRDALVRRQNRKLARLMKRAYGDVAYYRALFDRAGVKPQDVRSAADLHRIPLTSKDDLRRRPLAAVLATWADPGRLVCLKTSGSSGRPFEVRRTPLEEHLINTFRIRARLQSGVRVSDRIARVREAPLGGRTRGLAGHFRQLMGVFRDYHVDGLAEGEAIVQRLRELRPDVVTGYPSSIGRAAACLSGPAAHCVRPRVILTGGEVLTSSMRAHIENAFGAEVVDMYGAHEVNLIAWECREKGVYHVCDDNVVVEILEDGRSVAPGETGEVVVTALNSHAMPFIRYRTGDVATRGAQSCGCGRPYSTLYGIQGRALGHYHLAGNRWVHPFEITGPLIEREGGWILQHQLVQRSDREIVLRVAPLRAPRPEELARLGRLGRGKLGPGIEFTVEVVDDFPREPGGKFLPYPPPDGGWRIRDDPA